MECWGAQGGGNSEYPGGKGSYTCGILTVDASKTFYLVVGQDGTNDGVIFNNGSQRNYRVNGTSTTIPHGYCWAGGGATDIRLDNSTNNWTNYESRKSRIMVAASGGGSIEYYNPQAGQPGGPLNGNDGTSIGTDGVAATKGTQTSSGKIGTGIHCTNNSSNYIGFGYIPFYPNTMLGAGNGYYAGGQGNHGEGTVGVGATGSCFISGHTGCNAIKESSTENAIVHTGSPNHYSGYVFANTQMIAGNASMPAPNGGTETGHSGNGACIITQRAF